MFHLHQQLFAEESLDQISDSSGRPQQNPLQINYYHPYWLHQEAFVPKKDEIHSAMVDVS